MTEKYSKQIDFALEVLFLCLLFVSPLFFDRSLGIVFSLSKATLIRSFTVLIIALWISRVALTGQIKLIKTIADLPMLAYLMCTAAATLLSINVYVSFAGSYGRYEGLITTLNYVLLFFIAANTVTSVEKIKKIMVCAVVSGALMSVYGIIQRMGIDPFVWGGVITNERVISTIGQPNFLAAYLDMSFMLGIGLILFSGPRRSQFLKVIDIPQKGKKTKVVKQKPAVNWEEIIYQVKISSAFPLALLLFVYMIFNVDGITAPLMWILSFIGIFALLIYFTLSSIEMDSRILKMMVAFSVLLELIAILFTQSRGGLLGFLCGTVLISVFAGREIFFKNWKALCAIVLAMLVIVFSMFAFSKYSPMNRIRQEVNISSSETGGKIEFKSAAGSRLETWKSAFKLLVERPVLGVGPEVIKMVFPKYETPLFRFKEGYHVKQDRCHNEVLDTSITKGILTLFVYIWFLVAVFAAGARKLKERDESGFLTLAFLAGIFSYIVQNQFSFGVVAIGSLFWVMLGTVSATQSGPFYELRLRKDTSPKSVPVFYLVIVWIIAAALALLSFLPYVADMHYKAAKIFAESNLERAVAEHELSIKLSPFEGGYYTNYGITLLNNVATDKEKTMEMLKALAVLERGSLVDPYNADNYYMCGRVNLFLSQTGQKEKINEASRLSQRALHVDPYYAEAYQNLVTILQMQGKEDESAKMLEKAFESNPTLVDVGRALNAYYMRKGNPQELVGEYEKILSWDPGDPALLVAIGNVYMQSQNLAKASEKFDEALKTNPSDVSALTGKAEALFRQGKAKDALLVLQSALIIDPSNPSLHLGLGDYYLKAGDKGRAKEEFEQALFLDGSNEYAKRMLNAIR